MRQPCGLPDDLSFGPAISSCYRAFDFTLFFEDTILALVPCSIFIPIACVYIAVLAKRNPVATRTKWYTVKVTTYTALVLTNCILLAAIAYNSKTLTSASVPSATLSLVSSILMAFFASLEHTRALAPSPALVFFLAMTALVDIARVRTLYLTDRPFPAAALSASLALRLLLLALESRGKRKDLVAPHSDTCPEKLAGPISRTMFHWVNPLLMTGFRSSLTGRRLGPIDPELEASRLSSTFSAIPPKVQSGLSEGGLSAVTLACVGHHLLYAVIPRLCVSLFTFMQPFLIDAILGWLTRQDGDAMSQGHGLIGATFFVYFGIAASYSWYWHQVNKSVTMIRGGLIVVLFDKLLRLAEDPAMETRAMTLMFSDTQRVMSAMNYFHELWAGAIDTCIATWLLYRKTGPASFSMLAITIVSSAVCLSLSNKISRRQQKWLAAVEQRLTRTKRMLSSLKAVKMLSASDRMHSSVTALRRAELAVAWPFRRLQIITTAISYSSMTLAPPLVFGVYVAMTSGNHGLDVSKLFSSLTLISLLANPVMHLCQAIPALGAAYGCMARIQTFLELNEHSDRRTTMSPSKDADTPEQVLLSLKNVSLGWLAGKPILHHIHLDVKRGTRVAILGRIGAGEIALREDTTLAYCSQTPWLENVSAEENWTGRSPSRSPALLGKMIQDYALQNIQELHDYKTGTIGSQGVKLSGGQRQRLAMARAALLERDILLLDDVFSALDRRTKLHVAQSLLQARDGHDRRTVIFTTHDEHIANMADKIYEIDSAGIITRRLKRELPAETMAADEDSTPEVKEEASTSETCQASSSNSATITIPEPPLKDMDVYKTYLHSVGLGNAVLFLLLGGLYAVAMKFPDVWVQWWSNDSSAGGGGRHSTGYWIGVYAVLECLPLLMLGLWDWHLSYVVVPVAGMSLHTTLLTTVLDAPFAYISSVDAGSIINRFNQDLMFIDSQLPNALFNTVSELFVAVIQVVLVAVASAHALAAVPAVATVLYAVQRFYLRTSKQLRLLDLEAKAVLHSLVSDVAGGAGPSTLRAHGWQADVRARFLARLDASQEPIYLLFCVQRWLQLVLNLVVMGLVVLVAGVAVALRQRVNPGAVGVAFLNAATLGETLTQFILAYTSLETSLGAIARTTMFSASTPSERDDDERGAKRSSWWPSEGSVRLDNVWARYQLLADSQDASWSLRGISANIPAGQKVSICGRTGSGKSTFILALLRMVDIPIGTAYIGGQDHSQLPLAALRRGYLVVSQDLLDDSTILRDQIDPDGQFTDEQVQEVLAECGLQEIVEASGGLKASAAAVQLSNGETQFLSLARVLLYGSARQGGILLLDEATSSLDEDAQKRMERLIGAKLQDKTIISVCHKLPWALRSDRIIVLDKGEIIHDGAPQDIINESALFAGMSLPGS